MFELNKLKKKKIKTELKPFQINFYFYFVEK
jgi:hypothetical protein